MSNSKGKAHCIKVHSDSNEFKTVQYSVFQKHVNDILICPKFVTKPVTPRSCQRQISVRSCSICKFLTPHKTSTCKCQTNELLLLLPPCHLSRTRHNLCLPPTWLMILTAHSCPQPGKCQPHQMKTITACQGGVTTVWVPTPTLGSVTADATSDESWGVTLNYAYAN